MPPHSLFSPLRPKLSSSSNFPAILQIHTAVAPTLTARVGHEGQTKLQVQRAVAEGFLARDAVVEQLVLHQLAAIPLIGAGAVEQDEGVGRRLHPLGHTLPHHMRQRERLTLLGLAGELRAGDLTRPAAAFHARLSVPQIGGCFDPRLAVPTGAWQSARQELHGELAVAIGDDLGAELVLAVDLPFVLALHGEIGPRLLRIGENGIRFLVLVGPAGGDPAKGQCQGACARQPSLHGVPRCLKTAEMLRSRGRRNDRVNRTAAPHSATYHGVRSMVIRPPKRSKQELAKDWRRGRSINR